MPPCRKTSRGGDHFLSGGHLGSSNIWWICCGPRGRAYPGLRRRRWVIVPAEIATPCRPTASPIIYSPEDGARLGLRGMIDEVLAACDFDPCAGLSTRRVLDGLAPATGGFWPGPSRLWRTVRRRPSWGGAAGRGGRIDGARPGRHGYRRAGKSSLTDELVRRLRLDQDDRLRIAVISVDPTRRRTGGRSSATASA